MMWCFFRPVWVFALFWGALPCHGQINPVESEEFPILLRPRFEPDKTYRFVAVTQLHVAPPQEGDRLIAMEQRVRFDGEKLRGGQKGVALLGLTERLRVNFRSGPNTVAYDSLGEESQRSQLGQHFESIVNRYVKMELNEEMKVISSKEGGRSTGKTPLPELPRFGTEELVQIINTLPQSFSPDPVMTGNQWSLKGKRPVGELGELGFDINYQHLGYKKYEEYSCILINFYGNISGDITDHRSRTIEFQNSQISGNLYYDPSIEMTRFSQHNLSMVVNILDPDLKKRRPVPIQEKVTLKLVQIVEKE